MDEKLQPPTPREPDQAHPDQAQQQRLHQDGVTRRSLLMNIGIALNAVVAAAIATPVVAYFLGPVLKRREYLQWVAVGSASDFPAGETRLVKFRNPFTNPWDGETANIPAYVRCSEPDNFTAFAINCAHLGCPVRWFSESQLFMCPCHGGVYYADGSRASGPPERGLFTYDVKVESGQVMINAGQMPTLQNRAGAAPCPGATAPQSPALVARIESCPNTGPATRGHGTGASTIG